MVKLPQWQFVEDQNHRWHWTCATDHVRVVSAASLADRVGCLLHAVRTAVHARRQTVGRDAPAVPHELSKKVAAEMDVDDP